MHLVLTTSYLAISLPAKQASPEGGFRRTRTGAVRGRARRAPRGDGTQARGDLLLTGPLPPLPLAVSSSNLGLLSKLWTPRTAVDRGTGSSVGWGAAVSLSRLLPRTLKNSSQGSLETRVMWVGHAGCSQCPLGCPRAFGNAWTAQGPRYSGPVMPHDSQLPRL